MQATLDRGALLAGLDRIVAVVERRQLLPILLNVRLEAGGGALYLRGTDMDCQLDITEPAEVERSGATTVAAHRLRDVVKILPAGPITLQHPGGAPELALVRGGAVVATLPTMAAEEFPAIRPGDETARFALPAAELRRMIEATRHAISTEETRYYLNGIFFEKAHDRGQTVLRAVATDGHRLAVTATACPDGAEKLMRLGLPGAIVWRKAVELLRRLTARQDGAVDTSWHLGRETFVVARIGNATLTSKLVDGTFPEYERCIPIDQPTVVEFSTASLREAARAVKVVAADRAKSLRLNIEPDGSTAEAACDIEGGCRVALTSDLRGLPVTVGFNSRYLLDTLAALGSERVALHMSSGSAPVVLRDPSGGNTDVHVIMPMRV